MTNKESPKAQRQKLWGKLTSDPDVAAKCQILDGKSDEEKLHSMLNEESWGVDVDEESGLVYGPFKHAFMCIAKFYQLPMAPQSRAPVGAAPPTRSQLRLQRHTQIPVQNSQIAATSPP